MLGIGGGIVVEALAPGDGQAACGTGLAEQDVGGGPSAFVAGPPHLEHGFHLVDPGQRDGLAGVEHDDGVGIDGGDFFDEFVLIAGETEDGLKARPDEYDRDLGLLRGCDGLLVVGLALLGRVPVEADLHGRSWRCRARGLISMA